MPPERLLSEKGPFLSGNHFGVQDVAVASYLLFVPQFFPMINLSKWPNISSYMLACVQRPAYAQAFGPQVQGQLIRVCESWV